MKDLFNTTIMPREAIKCYEYYPDGKKVRTFKSLAEVRKEHYSSIKGKHPIFDSRQYRDFPIFKILPNGNVLFKVVAGRDKAKYAYKLHNSDLLFLPNEQGQRLQMLNLQHEVIAEFASFRIAYKILKIPQATIWGSLQETSTPKNDFYFKYKEF
jgi:hypothetical protein